MFLILDKTNDFQSVGQHLEERAHLWFFNPAQTQVAMFFRDCMSGWVPKGGNVSWKRHVYSHRVKAHHQFNVLLGPLIEFILTLVPFGVHVSHLSRTGMTRE